MLRLHLKSESLAVYIVTCTAPDGVLTIAYTNKNILMGTSGAATVSKKVNLSMAGGTLRYNLTSHTMEYCGYSFMTSYTWRAFVGTTTAALAPGGITSCPGGMNMVGDSGKFATYCIDAVARTSSFYSVAVSTCYGVTDSTAGRDHVCDFSEWSTACSQGLASSMGATWEWISAPQGNSTTNYNRVLVVGAYGCLSSNIFLALVDPTRFRFCIRRGWI